MYPGRVGMIWCSRKVGGGRAPRQPGQVRKEAAVTGSRPGRLPAFHPFRPPVGHRCTGSRRADVLHPFRPRRHRRSARRRSARAGPARAARAGRPWAVRRGAASAGRGAGPAACTRARPCRHALPGAGPQVPPEQFRGVDRPGRAGPHPAQRLRAEPGGACLHAHRRARRRQDHHRPHHRPRAELHRPGRQGRPDAGALRRLPGMPGDPRRPPSRCAGAGRRLQQRHRRRAGAARAAALPPGAGAFQGHHPGRGPYDVQPGLQRAC